MYIVKQNKKVRKFHQQYSGSNIFEKIKKNPILLEAIFENSIIYKPSLGSSEFPQRNGLFDVFWIETDQQSIDSLFSLFYEWRRTKFLDFYFFK